MVYLSPTVGDMTDVILAGVLAGLGVAIPVGAIAVLIIETSVRQAA